jgi:hypothetical protein
MVIPMFRLLPSISGYTVCASRADAQLIRESSYSNIFPVDYSVRFPAIPPTPEVCNAARRGIAVLPMLRSSPQAMAYIRQFIEPRAHGRRVVVINLRQYDYMPARNSNVKAWLEFAKSLDSARWLAVFVLDTSVANDPRAPELDGLNICEIAAWNVELRMALYEVADLTMGPAQGPMELCWLNDRCRYAMFVKPDSSPQTSEWGVSKHGFEMNKSPPYAVDGQRWVWSSDDYSAIRAVFEEMSGD